MIYNLCNRFQRHQKREKKKVILMANKILNIMTTSEKNTSSLNDRSSLDKNSTVSNDSLLGVLSDNSPASGSLENSSGSLIEG